MKAIMYHYIRNGHGNTPWLNYLDISDFNRQLDWLADNIGFVSIDHFLAFIRNQGDPPRGAILTFDDGLLDHYRYVYPELKRRGLWGIFFIPTGIFQGNGVLPVHLMHHLLGEYGSEIVYDAIKSQLTIDVLKIFEKDKAYIHQDAELTEKACKYYINYSLQGEQILDVTASLAKYFHINLTELHNRIYLSKDNLLEMVRNGMQVGAHSIHHFRLQGLTTEKARSEILTSIRTIHSLNPDQPISFCLPYGGIHSYHPQQRAILEEGHVEYCFDVKSEDIDKTSEKLLLPRYDCNEFPHGKSSNSPY